ncbi:MAG TPA: hypothetical protein VHF89_04170 [Solirubrobacteraceae bacterium]|nr:hypothetical protein [Solirubrobacteraceae bacterium]
MRAVPRPALAGGALLAVLVALAVALAVAGDDEPGAVEPTGRIQGVRLNGASCRHWIVASETERAGAVKGLTKSIGRLTAAGRGATLPDDEVVALFDRVCARREARHFLLYEIYIRAVGLRSVGAPPA